MKNLAFGKINYILLIAGVIIVLIGFVLMAGKGTTEEAFNPEIFSNLRIGVAPVVILAGFIFIIVAILFKGKNKKSDAEL